MMDLNSCQVVTEQSIFWVRVGFFAFGLQVVLFVALLMKIKDIRKRNKEK